MHAEWVATIAFYKAVQIVEAVFANHLKLHSQSHDSRIGELKRPVFADLFIAYRPLYAASLVARYLEDSSSRKCDLNPKPKQKYNTFSQYRSPEHVLGKLVKGRLQSLEQHAIQFLSEPARECLKRIQNDPVITREPERSAGVGRDRGVAVGGRENSPNWLHAGSLVWTEVHTTLPNVASRFATCSAS